MQENLRHERLVFTNKFDERRQATQPPPTSENLTKAVWLFRFGKRLMSLQPSMTAVVAARRSVDAFREEPDMLPERAAERNAEASSPIAA